MILELTTTEFMEACKLQQAGKLALYGMGWVPKLHGYRVNIGEWPDPAMLTPEAAAVVERLKLKEIKL